jgi:hypothetical protein
MRNNPSGAASPCACGTSGTSPAKQALVPEQSRDRAIRLSFCVFSLIFSYFAVRLTICINGFQAIFNDMLGGKPLPAITQFVLGTKWLWITSAFTLAFLPFLFAFTIQRTSHSLYGITGATGLQLIPTIFLGNALLAPLLSIISSMQNAP